MTWGLALGSGGLRGAAHIGVLKVLEKNKLRPDFIAGASAGAIAAAFYGAGLLWEKIESLISLGLKGSKDRDKTEMDAIMLQIKKHSLLPLGLLDGNNIEKMLKTVLGNKDFSHLAIPTSITATDLGTGRTVAYSNKVYSNTNSKAVFVTKVKVHEAVRASISIPGIFAPKKIGSRQLVDGGVTDSIPIDVLLDMGARKVIAVDLGISQTKEADNMLKILLQTMDIMSVRLAELSGSKADLLLKPDTFNAGLLDLQKIPALIRAGEDAANKNLEEIKKIASGKY